MINCEVSSEIYSENNYRTAEPPAIDKTNVVSLFKFVLPPHHARADEDGDLDVQRKPSRIEDDAKNIKIEHSQSTVLDLVGLQIWRGALLLADWLIHNGESLSNDSVILELASGVGLTSIVAAMFTPVICTDVNKGGILKLIESNIQRNKDITKHQVKVLELDFLQETINPEITEALKNIKIIIAADVVYDDDITEAFVRTVQKLLSRPPQRSVYVALEKRYVFTIADCDTAAPCYEHFLKCVKKLKNVTIEEVDLSFPKYFEYERVKELVLWKISNKI